ncbi:hypothetical protein OG204_24325 [Streptomyces sp. NBC_01387]|uniref:hypothetical protein n=1 Tax=unclassified Streptomyces TaxID=2593676 RepID=UPI002E32896A|nr:hypothetical protein [Streptomyces sp. NBC_01267]
MNRRSLPVVATLAAATALLLSACGGSDDNPKDMGKIAGADSGNEKPSSSPSASPSDTAGRPNITLAKDMKNVFEGGTTGDPVKDAVLRDNEQRISSLDDAINARSLDRPAFNFYNAGDAALSAAKWVKGFFDSGITWTGEVRYYDRKVTSLKMNVATLTYCSDESKSYNKDLKTGKKSGEVSDPTDSLVFYNTRLKKNNDGTWQTTEVFSQRGSKQCQ